MFSEEFSPEIVHNLKSDYENIANKFGICVDDLVKQLLAYSWGVSVLNDMGSETPMEELAKEVLDNPDWVPFFEILEEKMKHNLTKSLQKKTMTTNTLFETWCAVKAMSECIAMRMEDFAITDAADVDNQMVRCMIKAFCR